MVKTAIVMATYNGEKLLKEQLNSLKNQTLKTDYVIFRDDKSKDNTVNYLHDYIQKNKLENWIVQENEKNIGWKLTFRQLLLDTQKIDVDYVFLSDQDDEWSTNKVEEQLRVATCKNKLELLSCDFDVKNVNGEVYKVGMYNFNQNETISKYPKRLNYICYKLGFTYMVKSTLVKDLLEVWTPDFPNLAHDRILTLLSNLCETGYNLNKTLATHIYHGRNATGKREITVTTSKEKHLRNIKEESEYYQVAQVFLKNRGKYKEAEISEEYYRFYMRRYSVGKNSNLIKSLYQILKDWKYYFSMGMRARDIIFAFKSK